MKKTLAILLSAVMMLGLLAGCGSKTTEQPSTSGTENTETAALNVGVFYLTTLTCTFPASAALWMSSSRLWA